MTAPDPTFKARLFLGTTFTGAGIAHFVNHEVFEQVVPKPCFQWRKPISAVTGVIQILSGIAIFFPRMRAFARWSTVGLLVPTLPFAVDQINHPDILRKFGVPPAPRAGTRRGANPGRRIDVVGNAAPSERPELN